jgi:hypothetical protein
LARAKFVNKILVRNSLKKVENAESGWKLFQNGRTLSSSFSPDEKVTILGVFRPKMMKNYLFRKNGVQLLFRWRRFCFYTNKNVEFLRQNYWKKSKI